MKSKQIKIALLVSFSGEGGVERMMLNLAAGLLALDCRVDLLPIKKKSPFLDHVPRGVRIIDLKSAHTRTSLPALVHYLRREQPAGLLAAKDRANQVALLARRFSGVDTRIVIRLGTTVSASLAHRNPLVLTFRALPMKMIYPMADAIVAVSSGVAEDLQRILRTTSSRIHVIPNPVITPNLLRMARQPVTHPWLADSSRPVVIGMGRLTLQKDFETLLKAFAIVVRQRPSRLIILGEGRDKTKLKQLALHLDIAEHVDFPGFTANPYALLKRADLFVLSSLWEGSPNALCEALALGTPVVATDCLSGPREILDGPLAQYLVPMKDAKRMAHAMLQALTKPPGESLLRAAVQPYTMELSSKRYLQLLTARPD